MGKKAGKKAQSHDERAKTTSALSQPAATSASADSSSLLTRFSPSGRLFAQVSLAVDADTCRVYEVHSGQCVGRWASSSASERVSCVEWAELPSSSSSGLNTDEKTGRSKKRRKGSSTEGNDKQTGADGALEQDAGASASTSARADEASSPAAAFEVLTFGLKNASILILHPTQSTVIQTLSHSSVTSSPVSLSFASSSTSATRPSFLWSCTSSGQLSAWSLPSLAGSKGKLLGQYDTQCASCSEIAVRYNSSLKAQVNGMQNASTSAPLPTTAQILLGNFSIKLLEATLPSVTSGTSDSFERPRIHIKAEFSGHASEIIQLAWLNRAETEASQARFISIAKGDRFVSLWSALTTSHADTPVSGTLSATLGLDEEPRRIAVAADNQSICCISSDAARIISLEDAFTSSADQSSSQAPAGKQRRRNVRSLMAVSTITSPQATNPCTNAYFAYNVKNTIYVAAGVLKPSLERLVSKSAL